MKFSSTYRRTSSVKHLSPRRRFWQRFITIAACLLCAGLSYLAFRLVSNQLQTRQANLARNYEISEVLDAWERRDYQLVQEMTAHNLEHNPVDPVFLTFGGFAQFYLGLREDDGELRLGYMDRAVRLLRRALVVGQVELAGQVHYVLGKAYYFRGHEYYDAAIEHLNAAVQSGMESSDIWEYLALTYQDLGLLEASLDSFAIALQQSPESPALLLAAARLHLRHGQEDVAIGLARQARQISADQFLSEQAGLLLASIYLDRQDYSQARLFVDEVKALNETSADAWYYDGLVLAGMNDLIRARAAWRRAVSIDPMHSNARIKLNERL